MKAGTEKMQFSKGKGKSAPKGKSKRRAPADKGTHDALDDATAGVLSIDARDQPSKRGRSSVCV